MFRDASRMRYDIIKTTGRTGRWMRLLLFQLWRLGDLELGTQTFQREVGTIDCGGTRLKDGNLFQGLLWLFLKVIMERDWLGCEDVDECLDNIVV
jgi:hypothetical protein